MKFFAFAALFAISTLATPMASAVDVQAYIKKDTFESIMLSPNGDYYAATIPLENRTALAVLRRSDNKLLASFSLGKNTHVSDFTWVNPDRLIIEVQEKFGALAQPLGTGELYAMNADGSGQEILVGQRVAPPEHNTHIKPKKVERVAAYLVDDLPNDDKNVIISVMPFVSDPFTRAERMDVYSGRRAPVARAPVRNADFTTDNKGVVRFASGVGVDNVRKLYYREGSGTEWRKISDEAVSGYREFPVGFSADDATAYFLSEHATGPDSIVSFDIATETRKELLRDDNADPAMIIYRNGTSIPVGVRLMNGKPRNVFFDGAAPEARLYRSLEAAFGGDAVSITSQTTDGRLVLVQVWSDRNPGDFYVFDTVAKKADHLISRRNWFDPDRMAEMRPVQVKARDDLTLHGYLTLPSGVAASKLPMVVLPHGGPYGIQDHWGFETEAQMLANAGYAVLQLNFRGSAGFGREFKQSGAREWGGKMQDDLTDATRWAIQQGIADPGRICIYGGSYGGYASLMGVAKEPNLYKCAVGYVGVYDLPMMQKEDARESKRFGNWSSEWVGNDIAALGLASPNRLADRIKVPVFLAAGGEDEIAPIAHTKMMEKALRNAGVPVETLYYPNEGHGFYAEANRLEYYTKLLAFLSRHIGGAAASGAGPVTGK